MTVPSTHRGAAPWLQKTRERKDRYMHPIEFNKTLG